MNGQFWWYVARASGMVSWVMLTASVIWGVVLSTKAFPEQRRPAWLLDLHKWLGGLTMAFLAVHLGALVADGFTSFGLGDLTIPYWSSWRPGAVALGVVAMWSLVAVEITSYLRRRMSKRSWRAVHLLSYAAFWCTSLHAAFAGSDRSAALYRVTAMVTVAAVAWAALYRITHRGRRLAI